MTDQMTEASALPALDYEDCEDLLEQLRDVSGRLDGARGEIDSVRTIVTAAQSKAAKYKAADLEEQFGELLRDLDNLVSALDDVDLDASLADDCVVGLLRAAARA